jgi:cytochrome c oxidase subunit 4
MGGRMEEDKKSSSYIIPYRNYILIWAAYMVLLAMTAIISKMQIKYHIAYNLTIATTMAVLQLVFFMHLRYEGKFLKRIIFLAIFAISFIILLTFSDVLYRYR